MNRTFAITNRKEETADERLQTTPTSVRSKKHCQYSAREKKGPHSSIQQTYMKQNTAIAPETSKRKGTV
jgi:hypothetical protein